MVSTASLFGAGNIKKCCGDQTGKLSYCILGQGIKQNTLIIMWKTGGPVFSLNRGLVAES